MMMKSTKPYLFEAMYRWMVDSNCTPLVKARTDILGVEVPLGYAVDNEIVLDIAIDSVENFNITEHLITFNAVFEDKVCSIRLPMIAVLSIQTAEEGVGMEFEDEDDNGGSTEDQERSDGKPDLRVL
jgi:stringent starvation protein B